MINILLIKDTTLNDVVYSILSSIYNSSIALCDPLVYGIIIIAIILLASPMSLSNILHTEAHYLKITKNQDPNSMNMVYVRTLGYSRPDYYKYFVFDRNDPTGANLSALFLGKQYNTHTQGGFQGYVLTDNYHRKLTRLDGSIDICVPILDPCMALLEARGTPVLSRATPVEKTTNLSGGTALVVKKDI